MNIRSASNLKDICNTIMNMDPRVHFVGVLTKDAELIEGGMRKDVSLLSSDKDDLFYLRIISHLNELKDLANTLGDLGYVLIKMASFIISTIRNYMVE